MSAAANRNAPAAENRNADLDEPGLQSVPDDSRLGYTYVRRCDRCRRKFVFKNAAHRYCSPACKRAVENVLRRRKRLAERGDADRSCDGCGESFRPKRKTAIYCSNRCRQAAYRTR